MVSFRDLHLTPAKIQLCMLFPAVSFIQQRRVRKSIWYLIRWLSPCTVLIGNVPRRRLYRLGGIGGYRSEI